MFVSIGMSIVLEGRCSMYFVVSVMIVSKIVSRRLMFIGGN